MYAQENSDQTQQVSSGMTASFTIGVSTQKQDASSQVKTSKVPTAQQTEEKRKNEIFQLDTYGQKNKRSREEFAEKLRKERR